MSPHLYYPFKKIRLFSLLLDKHTKSEIAFVKVERNYFGGIFCLKTKSYCSKYNTSFSKTLNVCLLRPLKANKHIFVKKKICARSVRIIMYTDYVGIANVALLFCVSESRTKN